LDRRLMGFGQCLQKPHGFFIAIVVIFQTKL
jgi:hypothetical protein